MLPDVRQSGEAADFPVRQMNYPAQDAAVALALPAVVMQDQDALRAATASHPALEVGFHLLPVAAAAH
jgi:hypothetical protein